MTLLDSRADRKARLDWSLLPDPAPGFENTSYERDELNRFEKIVGTVLEPVMKLPGAETAMRGLEKVAIPGEVGGGLVSSIVGSTIQELRDRGASRNPLTWAKPYAQLMTSPFQVLASPITGDAGIISDIWDRQQEMIGMSEDQELDMWAQLKAARAFQRDRDSLFFGEKLITETLFDPLTYLAGPLLKGATKGTRIALKTPRTTRVGGSLTAGIRGAYQEVGAQALAKQEKKALLKESRRKAAKARAQLDENGQAPEFIQTDNLEEVIGDNVNPTRGRNALQIITKSPNKAIAAIGARLSVVSPDLVLSKAADGDQLAIAIVARAILEENAKSVLNVNKTGISILERSAGLAGYADDTGNHVIDLVRKSDGELETVLFDDLMERALTPRWNSQYVIDDGVKELVGKVHRFTDHYFDEAVERGVKFDKTDDLSIIDPDMEGWHYYPRLTSLIRNRADVGDAQRYNRESLWSERVNDLAEESANNGAVFGGAEMASPITETMDFYAKVMIETMVDEELIATIAKRQIFTVKNSKRTLVIEEELTKLNNTKTKYETARRLLGEVITDPKKSSAAIGRALKEIMPELAEDLKAITRQRTRKTKTGAEFKTITVRGQTVTNGDRLNDIQRKLIDADHEQGALVKEKTREWGELEAKQYEEWATQIKTGDASVNGLRAELKAAEDASELLDDAGEAASDNAAKIASIKEELKTARAIVSDVKAKRAKAIESLGKRLSPRDKKLRGRAAGIARRAEGMGISNDDFDAFMRWMDVPGPEGSGQILNIATNVSDAARFGALTFDFGVGLIQGSMVLVNFPRAWVKAIWESFQAFADPQRQKEIFNPATKYGADNMAIVREMDGGLIIGSEYFDAVAQGGVIASGIKRIPKGPLRKGLQSTIDRFRASFEVFLTVARLEIAKAFRYKVQFGEMSRNDVVDFANKFTGITSSRKLGVKSTQRQVEAAGFALAPRYFRAITGLMVDATQGGFRGEQARKSMAKFFGATVAAYIGIAAAMGQTPKLDPRSTAKGGDGGKFLTVEINGHNIGLGSKPISLMRHLFKAASDPSELTRLDSRNLMLSFARTNMPPLTSTATDVIMQKTFLGEPVDPLNAPGSFINEEVLGRALPFWAESLLNDDPRPGFTGVAADIIGLRSWPLNVSDQLRSVQDDVARFYPQKMLGEEQENYMHIEGIVEPTWAVLNQNQRAQIIRGADFLPVEITSRKDDLDHLKKLSDKFSRESGKNKNITDYLVGLESARTGWEMSADNLDNYYKTGAISRREYREELKQINRAYGDQVTDVIEANPEGREELEDNRTMRRERGDFIPTFNEAREYYTANLVAADNLTDEFGQFKYDVYDAELKKFQDKFGVKIADEVRAYSMNNRRTPKLVRQWLSDREILRPYWNVTDAYLKSNPRVRALYNAREMARNTGDIGRERILNNNPLLKRMDRYLSGHKLLLRENNPRLDATLIFWGAGPTTPLTPLANSIYERMIAESYRKQ